MDQTNTRYAHEISAGVNRTNRRMPHQETLTADGSGNTNTFTEVVEDEGTPIINL